MFSCDQLTVVPGPGKPPILARATARFMGGRMNAVIGPSGCGKTTLVKALLGVIPASGEVRYGGAAVTGPEALVGRVGFVPQFSIAQPNLSVRESLAYALELFVVDRASHAARLGQVLDIIGLSAHRDKRVRSLSGGQLRRLGLGMELVSDPECLICDEVTSGLDPNSEDALLRLMRDLCETRGKSFVCIIHNLAKLDCFDWITLVHQGAVVFQGTLGDLLSFFRIPDALHLYDRLNEHPLEHWLARWEELQESLQARHDGPPPLHACDGQEATPAPAAPAAPAPAIPGVASQLLTLLDRRLKLFGRDRGYLALVLAITLGFPCLVVIFAFNGLPVVDEIARNLLPGSVEFLRAKAEYVRNLATIGSLVSGLLMFQVILLTLMGSNNGSREIAAERPIYEKERLNGLSPAAYVASKCAFTALVGCMQGLWMCAFVKLICGFPGDWGPQLALSALCCLAMTWLSLGFSAIFHSAEKAGLLAVYFVGFQLPLSGVILKLPAALEWICRPCINAYWSWSGWLSTMEKSRHFDAVLSTYNEPWIPSVGLCLAVLAAHAIAGGVVAFYGCQRRQWV